MPVNTIICPVDFSETSLNATEHAAKYAQCMASKLLIVNVRRMSLLETATGGSAAAAAAPEPSYDAKLTLEKLEGLCDVAKAKFKISADYEVNASPWEFANVISAAMLTDGVIVMGTNGEDSLYQEILGSNSYRMIRNSRCPVLVVPDGVSYATVSRIVYGWDYSHEGISAASQLDMLFGGQSPAITFLHVEKKENSCRVEDVAMMRRSIRQAAKNSKTIFDTVCAGTKVDGLSRYLEMSGADLLSVTFSRNHLVNRIFGSRLIKELVSKTRRPLLVLPCDELKPACDG
jgi:nucleotide-binding universal stress UspA family protein